MENRLLSEPPIVRRSAGVDLLRFFFALWVICAHTISWAGAAQGPDAIPASIVAAQAFLIRLFQPYAELHPAVIGFIVLSGYCIHRNGLRDDPAALPAYAARRLFRIVPVFLLASAAGLLALHINAAVNPALTLAINGMPSLDSTCLLPRLTTLAALLPYFHPCSFSGNAPLATVMVEIDLYIVYGLVFALLVWPGRRKLMAAFLVLTVVVALALVAVAPGSMMYWLQQYSLWTYLPLWWFGVLMVNRQIADRVLRWWPLLAAAWLAMVLATPLYLSNPVAGEIKKYLFAGLLAAAIVAIDRLPIRASVFSLMGRAGYSIYAFHAPILAFALMRGAHPVVAIAAALVVGLASYAMIERPAMNLGRAATQRAAQPTQS